MEALGYIQCYFVAWGEGKQEVLLECHIVLIALLDGVAACDNSNNIEMYWMWWQLVITAVILKCTGCVGSL